MKQLNQKFYKRPPEEVAKDLVGKTIKLNQANSNTISVYLTEITAYKGATKKTSSGVFLAPGILTASYKFGNYLLDIATKDKDEAACVTITGIGFDNEGELERIVGPGRVTKMFGITKENVNKYNNSKVYNASSPIRIYDEGLDTKEIKHFLKKGSSANCLGSYKL